jgi:hypothetical protein
MRQKYWAFSEDSGDLTNRFRHLIYPCLGSLNLVGQVEGALQAKGEEEKCDLLPWMSNSTSGTHFRTVWMPLREKNLLLSSYSNSFLSYLLCQLLTDTLFLFFCFSLSISLDSVHLYLSSPCLWSLSTSYISILSFSLCHSVWHMSHYAMWSVTVTYPTIWTP